MKIISKRIITLILISMCFVFVGCASTSTSESTGQYIDSATTTAKVKASLINALGVGSITNIEVTTYKGVVQLSGFVNSQTLIDKAIAATKQVDGVVAVENSLVVKKGLK